MELQQLIGTETCSYCSLTSECLSLPEEDGEPRAACEDCTVRAFRAHWGGAFQLYSIKAWLDDGCLCGRLGVVAKKTP